MQRLTLALALLASLSLAGLALANDSGPGDHGDRHHSAMRGGPNRDYDWFSDSDAASRPQYQFYSRDFEVFGYGDNASQTRPAPAGGLTSDHYGRYSRNFNWNTRESWFADWYGTSDRWTESR